MRIFVYSFVGVFQVWRWCQRCRCAFLLGFQLPWGPDRWLLAAGSGGGVFHRASTPERSHTHAAPAPTCVTLAPSPLLLLGSAPGPLPSPAPLSLAPFMP